MEKESEFVARARNNSRRGRLAKQGGEAAEAAFLSKAASLGFQVAKP